jgi:pyridoxine 4-dehydrogenase
MPMRFCHGPETIHLGDLEVRRLGFGAMRLPGKGVWGEPSDPATAHAVLKRAIELGVNFFDTAWYYGPHVANRLITEALHPYPSDVVIATKVGVKRTDDKGWAPALTAAEIREAVETDLRSLRLEQLPVVHLHWIGDRADVPLSEALDVLVEEQRAGKVRHIALANVTLEQLDEAQSRADIVAVQNMLNIAGQSHAGAHAESVLDACEDRGIAFIPYFPQGVSGGNGGSLDTVAKRLGCTPHQLAIAWLLARSPVMLPIPGTSQITHLEDNVGAVHVALDDTAITELSVGAPRLASPAQKTNASYSQTPRR